MTTRCLFQFSLLRFGNASSDERWVESFTSLPKIWAQHGVTQGGCTMKQYSSYYDYQVTVPNTTYATVVSMKVIMIHV